MYWIILVIFRTANIFQYQLFHSRQQFLVKLLPKRIQCTIIERIGCDQIHENHLTHLTHWLGWYAVETWRCLEARNLRERYQVHLVNSRSEILIIVQASPTKTHGWRIQTASTSHSIFTQWSVRRNDLLQWCKIVHFPMVKLEYGWRTLLMVFLGSLFLVVQHVVLVKPLTHVLEQSPWLHMFLRVLLTEIICTVQYPLQHRPSPMCDKSCAQSLMLRVHV